MPKGSKRTPLGPKFGTGVHRLDNSTIVQPYNWFKQSVCSTSLDISITGQNNQCAPVTTKCCTGVHRLDNSMTAKPYKWSKHLWVKKRAVGLSGVPGKEIWNVHTTAGMTVKTFTLGESRNTWESNGVMPLGTDRPATVLVIMYIITRTNSSWWVPNGSRIQTYSLTAPPSQPPYKHIVTQQPLVGSYGTLKLKLRGPNQA